jgi:hypothetical protein
VTLIDCTDYCYEEIPRSVLFDRWQEAREAREAARKEAERQARELERRTIVDSFGHRDTLDELRQVAEGLIAEVEISGYLEGMSPHTVLALIGRIEELLDEVDNGDC